MRLVKSLLLASTFLASSAAVAHEDFSVVASIKPIHSLVAAVMEGAGEPGLIVKGAGSPHTYSLRPSEASMLQEADVVFWVGHDLEPFLEGPLENIAGDAKTIELLDAHDLVKLEFREGGAFDDHGHDDHGDEHAEHDHDEHGHEEHAEHDHDEHDHEEHAKEAKAEHDHEEHDHDEHAGHDHDEHDHEEHAKEAKAEHDHEEHDHDEHAEHDHDEHDHDEHAKEAKAEHDHDEHDHEEHASHDDHEGHDHGEHDPHVWLDPVNAKALVHEIEEALVAADPAHAATYEANAEAVTAKLDALISEVETDMAGLSDKGFIVFHDAYHYFESRFGLEAAGSVTLSPEVMPGAESVVELREKIEDLGATCIFSEPQFEPQIVQTLAEGTDAKTGVLDPLGADLTDGPDLYFTLIRNMASSFKSCLGGES